jgi:hypothetical protein
MRKPREEEFKTEYNRNGSTLFTVRTDKRRGRKGRTGGK